MYSEKWVYVEQGWRVTETYTDGSGHSFKNEHALGHLDGSVSVLSSSPALSSALSRESA